MNTASFKIRANAFALFTLALALRLWHLDHLSLWLDESATLYFAKQPIAKTTWDCFHHEPSPGLYYLFMHAWISMFGESDFVLRLPSAFFGSLTVAMTYLVGRKFFSEKVGLLAAILTATVPIQLQYSQECRVYALFSFLCLLVIHLMPEGRWHSKSQRWWLLLAETCLLYAHFYGLFLWSAQLAFLLLRLRNKDEASQVPTRQAIGMLMLAAVLASPWYAALIIGFPAFHDKVLWIENYPHSNPFSFMEIYFGLQPLPTTEFYKIAYPFVGTLLTFTLLGIWGWRANVRFEFRRIARGEVSATALLILWVVAAFFAPLALILIGKKFFILRYGLASATGLYLLAFAAIEPVLSRIKLPTLLFPLTIVSVFWVHAYFADFQKQDWKNAAALAMQTDPSLPILINPFDENPRLSPFHVVPHYVGDDHVIYVLTVADIRKQLAQHGRLWLLLADYMYEEDQKEGLAQLARDFTVTRYDGFAHVVLTRIEAH